MGIWLYEVTNMGDYRSVVKYGTLPNGRGPTGNGYSVLLKNRSATPDWCIGAQGNPVVAETKLKGRYSWKIYDHDWKLKLFVSIDGGDFLAIGAIRILHNYGRFDLWTCGDSIVIGNADHKLGRESDGQSFRYFHVFKNQISTSNYPPV